MPLVIAKKVVVLLCVKKLNSRNATTHKAQRERRCVNNVNDDCFIKEQTCACARCDDVP